MIAFKAVHGNFFTDTLPDDHYLWTSAFLNERFPLPVSPLGWTLIRELLEPLGFLDPLRFMGYRWPADVPVTKLHGGRPFVNVLVFQILYKPFPDWLLPEDAARFFPDGDTSLRRRAPYPRGMFDPRLIAALLRNFLRDPANWSPFHNWRVWEKFTAHHDRAMASLRAEPENPAAAWALMEQAQALNARLLAIHRWSLTHADLTYSLLRRRSQEAARLVAGVPNKSVELNRALAQARTEADWDAFFEQYGHRSFSLDIYRPTFAESREEVRRLAAGQSIDRPGGLSHRGRGRMARRYMRLREDQRFYWQKTLALQRELALYLGQRLLRVPAPSRSRLSAGTEPRASASGREEDLIFFAAVDELRAAVRGKPLPVDEMERRRAEFLRLGRGYPPFLRGREPLVEERGELLRGRPVSPGTAQGPARVLTSAAELGRIRPGDILVTRAADPGWTVVFGSIAGLVLEVGGQLSHAAVVAREYGLPAVAGVRDATRLLADGQRVSVDGTSGLVRVLKE